MCVTNQKLYKKKNLVMNRNYTSIKYNYNSINIIFMLYMKVVLLNKENFHSPYWKRTFDN